VIRFMEVVSAKGGGKRRLSILLGGKKGWRGERYNRVEGCKICSKKNQRSRGIITRTSRKKGNRNFGEKERRVPARLEKGRNRYR